MRFASGGDRRLFLVVFAPVIIVYLATMRWVLPVNIDAFTNTLTAHYVGTTGAPYAVEHGELITGDPAHQFSWFYETEQGPLSPYPPAGPYLAAPFYAVAGSELTSLRLTSTGYENSLLESSTPPVWPGSLLAALSTAIAVGFLGLTFARLGSVGEALVGAWVAGFGTSLWSVAADQLWQHGPSVMFLAMAAYLTLTDREWWAGLAFGGAVLSRPQGAVVALIVGLGLAWVRRSPMPAVRIGAGSLFGAGLLVGYHRRYSGEWTVIGGASLESRLVGGSEIEQVGEIGGPLQTVLDYLWNVVQGVIGFDQGFLLWSPFLLILLFGMRSAWPEIPRTVKVFAAAGVGFLLVQYWIQTYGHDTYFGYRYPLEGLIALSLAFFATAVTWRRGRPLVLGASALAVALFAAGSITD